jgi:hypothetical protein
MNHTRKIAHFYTLMAYLTIKKVKIILLHIKKLYMDVYKLRFKYLQITAGERLTQNL